MAYSGGKDCTLALDRMLRAGHTCVALMVAVGIKGQYAVLTIGLDSATLSFDGNDYTAPLGYSGGYLIFVADSEIELTITYDNGAVDFIEGYVDGGYICVTTVGDIVKMEYAEE